MLILVLRQERSSAIDAVYEIDARRFGKFSVRFRAKQRSVARSERAMNQVSINVR